jgi:hypothetical protein
MKKKSKKRAPDTAVVELQKSDVSQPKAEEPPKCCQDPCRTVESTKKEGSECSVQKPGMNLKTIAVIALFILVVAFAYYFFFISSGGFTPGYEVSADTFKSILQNSEKVSVVMDIRKITNSNISDNVLQCGVDFAGSSGLSGKNLSIISIDDNGCIAANMTNITTAGNYTIDECFSIMQNMTTIYVKSGSDGARYYSKGMVVTVGPLYKFGTCNIRFV